MEDGDTLAPEKADLRALAGRGCHDCGDHAGKREVAVFERFARRRQHKPLRKIDWFQDGFEGRVIIEREKRQELVLVSHVYPFCILFVAYGSSAVPVGARVLCLKAFRTDHRCVSPVPAGALVTSTIP